MLLQQRRNNLRAQQHRRHGGGDRCYKIAADAGGGGTDQHDFVAIFIQRNLAVIDVIKRIDAERGRAVYVVVKVRRNAAS